MNNSRAFKWRHFEAEIILLCVRWYLRYALSYRDLEEMMRQRGLHVDHTTIYRWIQHYVPELEKRCRPHLKATNNSWRVDETYVKIKKPGCTFIGLWTRDQQHVRVPPEPDTRCRSGQTLFLQNACCTSHYASSRHHGG